MMIMKWPIYCLFLITWPLFGQVKSSLSGELPLIEAGAGAASFSIPDYPGSDQSSTISLPFPTAIIRDETFRVDENGGARGRFFKSEYTEINLSFGGALPVKSKNNRARSGMSNIDPLIEVGPGLIITLIKPSSIKQKLSLNIPIRLGLSTDFKSLDSRGFVFNPLLFYYRESFLVNDLILFTSLDARWTTEQYQDYFYEVAPEYARSGREQYNARGGYSGSSASIGLSYSWSPKWTTFAGFHYSYYDGATNWDSPLLISRRTISFGAGFIWWFYQSEARGVR